MALQSALQFIRAIRSDAALQERVRGLVTDDAELHGLIALAAEHGLSCTEAELRKAYGLDWGLRAGARTTQRAKEPAGEAPLWPHRAVKWPDTLLDALTLGNVVRFEFPAAFTFVAHPDDAARVLSSGTYRRDWGYAGIREILGRNMLTTDGDEWMVQRRRAQPAFRAAALDARMEHVREVADRLAHRWRTQGNSVDVLVDVGRALAESVGDVFMGAGAAATTAARLPPLLAAAESRPGSSVEGAEPDATGCTHARRHAIETVRECMAARQEPLSGDDFLATLFRAHGKTAVDQADGGMIDEAGIILATGAASTSASTCWMLWLLATHPHVADAVDEETRSGGQDLARAVVRETLRLYPPAWLLPRHATQDDEIGGYVVSKGSVVAVSPYATQRHPDFWPEPMRFDPSRFLGTGAERHRHAYFPFGGGAHHCIGHYFAVQQLTILLTTLCGAVRFNAGGERAEMEAGFTIHPKRLVLQVSPRR